MKMAIERSRCVGGGRRRYLRTLLSRLDYQRICCVSVDVWARAEAWEVPGGKAQGDQAEKSWSDNSGITICTVVYTCLAPLWGAFSITSSNVHVCPSVCLHNRVAVSYSLVQDILLPKSQKSKTKIFKTVWRIDAYLYVWPRMGTLTIAVRLSVCLSLCLWNS